jgi:hypothetical protein
MDMAPEENTEDFQKFGGLKVWMYLTPKLHFSRW